MTIEELKALVDKSGLSYGEIARILNKGKGTISSVMNGKYSSSNLNIIQDAIATVCKNMINGVSNNDSVTSILMPDDRFMTMSQEVLQDRLERILLIGTPFFESVSGDSGVGKTYAVQSFCRDRTDVLYVKARENQSVSMLARALLKATGERVGKGNADELCTAFCETCFTTGVSMVIIDEADLWVNASNEAFSRKIELVREIYEAGISVVLVGLPELRKRIAKLDGYVKNRITSMDKISVNQSELVEFGRMKGMVNTSTLAKNAPDYGNLRMFAKIEQNMWLGHDESTALRLLGMIKKDD